MPIPWFLFLLEKSGQVFYVVTINVHTYLDLFMSMHIFVISDIATFHYTVGLIIGSALFCRVVVLYHILYLVNLYSAMPAVFSNIFTIDTAYFAREEEARVVYCEFKVWLIFCCCDYNIVRNIMTYCTALYIHIYQVFLHISFWVCHHLHFTKTFLSVEHFLYPVTHLY